MYKFGTRSKERLATAHPDLQLLMNNLIQVMDVTILEGHRDKETQNSVYQRGLSKLEWPNSKHNSLPSKAVDVAPYPIDWHDEERFVLMAGIIKGLAHAHGIKIRWGADWDSDNVIREHRFLDFPHFELVET